MKMKNHSTSPARIPGDIVGGWETSGPRPESVEVPPGAIVEIRDSYACRRRTVNTSNPHPMPSVAHDLSGGALRPHGAEAVETFKQYVDQLPEVVLAHVRDNLKSEHGVSSRPDPHEAARKEAEAFGRAMLDKMRESRATTDVPARPRFHDE